MGALYANYGPSINDQCVRTSGGALHRFSFAELEIEK